MNLTRRWVFGMLRDEVFINRALWTSLLDACDRIKRRIIIILLFYRRFAKNVAGKSTRGRRPAILLRGRCQRTSTGTCGGNRPDSHCRTINSKKYGRYVLNVLCSRDIVWPQRSRLVDPISRELLRVDFFFFSASIGTLSPPSLRQKLNYALTAVRWMRMPHVLMHAYVCILWQLSKEAILGKIIS